MRLYLHEDDLGAGTTAAAETVDAQGLSDDGAPVAPSEPMSGADTPTPSVISDEMTEIRSDDVCEQEHLTDGRTEENVDSSDEPLTEEDRPAVGGHYAPEGTVPTLGEGQTVLSVRNLYKGYRKGSYVLENFSLDVAKGQIVGLLGPNGCGKTTLLKMISGLLVPDRGSILVAGEQRTELSNINISYLPERTYFTPGMRVSALLDYFADFYEDFDRALAEQMLADLDIPMEQKLRALSKGMKEKVQLVLVMSRKTKLYLLDEPIGGVDPAAREYVLSTILSRYNTDASVIITTHLIADIEPVLDSFAFLGYGGEILAYGSSEDARAQTGKSLDELFREVFRCYRRL